MNCSNAVPYSNPQSSKIQISRKKAQTVNKAQSEAILDKTGLGRKSPESWIPLSEAVLDAGGIGGEPWKRKLIINISASRER